MYQAKSGVKKFSLYYWGGGGVSTKKKNFFQSEHVLSQIWCQKFFPLLGGGGGVPLTKNFFSSLNMYQTKSGVKNFSPWLRLGPPPVQGWISLFKNLRPGTPPPVQGWISLSENLRPGTPPPPQSKCGQIHRQVSKHYLPVVLRTRAVTRRRCSRRRYE